MKEAISSSVAGIQNHCSLKLTDQNWLEQFFTVLNVSFACDFTTGHFKKTDPI